MKIRRELSGLHLFDRNTGLHILFDELGFEKAECDSAPRTLSIALTNACDLRCHFCYAPKSRHRLEYEYVEELAKRLDILGALEITLGGGEPFLYPNLAKLCRSIYKSTSLAINITTHGHHVDERIMEEFDGALSSIRFSIDGLEPRYSEIRGRPLKSLLDRAEIAKAHTNVGFNATVMPGQSDELRKILELATDIQIRNILIIPIHEEGNYSHNEDDWREIENIINEFSSEMEILVTAQASHLIGVDQLETETKEEFSFAHVSADKLLKSNSYTRCGFDISDLGNLSECLNRARDLTQIGARVS